MNGKIVVYIFIAVIVAIFAYYYTNLPQTSSVVNPIDPNNEFEDYLMSDYGNWVEIIVIGRFEGIVGEDLLVRTGPRTIAIRKPADTTYLRVADTTGIPLIESDLVENELVRVTATVDKATSQITELKVDVVRIMEDGKVIPFPGNRI